MSEGHVREVVGSRGDLYYVSAADGVDQSCTCPSFFYRGGPCKHMEARPTASRPRSYGYASPAPTMGQAIRDRVTSLLPRGVQAVVNDVRTLVLRTRAVYTWLEEKFEDAAVWWAERGPR